jgi:hypothetical protein
VRRCLPAAVGVKPLARLDHVAVLVRSTEDAALHRDRLRLSVVQRGARVAARSADLCRHGQRLRPAGGALEGSSPVRDWMEATGKGCTTSARRGRRSRGRRRVERSRYRSDARLGSRRGSRVLSLRVITACASNAPVPVRPRRRRDAGLARLSVAGAHPPSPDRPPASRLSGARQHVRATPHFHLGAARRTPSRVEAG